MTRSRRIWTICLGLAVAAGWFAWLRPATLGGQQTYIVVDGPSMRPTYQDGDFVLVREEARYGIGDIVAFRVGGEFDDPTRVIHRIIGEAGNGAFITRGDNRDRNDPWQPTAEDIVGRAVVHVPHAGDVAGALGRPPALAALGGAAVVLGRSRRRRRSFVPRADTVRENKVQQPSRTSERMSSAGRRPRWIRHTQPRWAFVGGIVAAALAVPTMIGLWSSIQAATTAVQVDTLGNVDDQVAIDYRFVGPPSSVYPTGEVKTEELAGGVRAPAEPLFSRLLDRVELAVEFRSEQTGAEQFSSTYQLEVVLSMPDGYRRALASVPPTAFNRTATQVLTVDLSAAAAQVAEVAALTGVGGQKYTITLTPSLAIDASSGGSVARDVLAPSVEFVIDDGVIQAQPVGESTRSVPLTLQVVEPTRYRLGPVSVETPTARGLLAGLALVLVVAAGWFASVLFGGLGLSEAERIAARYRMQLVDVSTATGPPGAVVMVGGIGELARLAKVEQSVILHEDLGDGAHRYRVFLGAVTYEYETAPEHGGGAHAVAIADVPGGDASV